MTEHKTPITIDVQSFEDATREQIDHVCKEFCNSCKQHLMGQGWALQ